MQLTRHDMIEMIYYVILCLQVISSIIPNDDFGGFEPLRPQVKLLNFNSALLKTNLPYMLTGALTFLQKPGFYQPKGDGAE